MRNVAGDVEMSGYFNTDRSEFGNVNWWGDGEMTPREAWLWLRSEAAYQPTETLISSGRAYKKIILQRGEICHSLSFLAEAWGWSEKRVRTFLKFLEREGIATIRPDDQTKGKTNKFPPVMRICNYNVYQMKGLAVAEKGTQNGAQTALQTDAQAPSQAVGSIAVFGGTARNESAKSDAKGHTKGHQLNKREEIEERNRAAQRFSEFWAVYPLKVGRAAAEISFAKAISRIDVDDLLLRTRAFADSWKHQDDKRFIPGPVKFLDEERYLDVKPPPTDDEWRKRLEYHRSGGDWVIGWGPSPGRYGCKIPKHLLAS
jgi:hypothetical protein